MTDNVSTQTAALSSVASGTGIATKQATHQGDANQHIQVMQLIGVSGSEGSYTLTEIGTNLGVLIETTSTVLDLTLSLDTSAYADGDVLAATQEVSNAVRESGGSGVLQSIVVVDKDDQGEALDIVIFDSSATLGTENAAVSISDADAAKILGIVEVLATDYVDLVNSQLVTKDNLGIVVEASGSASLYVAAISRGTGTYTASGIVLRLGILQD
jgi:hypothetical protein